MKKILSIFTLTTLQLFSMSAIAADKVVVVPLSSNRVAGSDGQLQYNDNGSLNGSEVYYNKAESSIGIGTPNPESGVKLHVKGFSRFDLGQTKGNLYITTPGSYPGFIVLNQDNSKRSDISFKNGNIYLNTSDDGTLPATNNGMIITTTGEVGIGTENPIAKLEVTGELRTVDSNGNKRLWAEGRPGVEISGSWTNSPAIVGVDYAVSKTMSSWYSAPSACPIGTWVCTLAEVNGVNPPASGYQIRDCLGGLSGTSDSSWVADGATDGLGSVKNGGGSYTLTPCYSLQVLCCRETPSP